jgi:hypothetical protein
MVRRRRTTKRAGLDDPRYHAARAELKRIGNHICHLCGHEIDLQLKWPHPLSWSCDHQIARTHLHPDDPRHWHISALRESHLHCNTARGARPAKRPTPLTDFGDIKGLDTSIDW